MVLSALREKNLAKIEEENDKKFECSLAKSERERKSWKTFEKDVWNSQRTVFKEPETWSSIDRKTGSKAHWIFLNRILIDRKSDWINRISWKTAF